MKNILKLNFLAVISIGLSACTGNDFDSLIYLKASANSIRAGEMVTFTILGDAETYVIFPGDERHMYDSSLIVLTINKDVVSQVIALPCDSLEAVNETIDELSEKFNESIRKKISDAADSHSIDSLTRLLLSVDEIAKMKAHLKAEAGVPYSNADEVEYRLGGFLQDFFSTAERETINMFASGLKQFYVVTSKDVFVIPQGGYHTGIVVDRNKKELSYTYNKTGFYEAVLLATRISDKQYHGSGYKKDASTSGEEYRYYRVVKKSYIKVGE